MRCIACDRKLKDNESYWKQEKGYWPDDPGRVLHRYEDMCKSCRRYVYNNDETPESSDMEQLSEILGFDEGGIDENY